MIWTSSFFSLYVQDYIYLMLNCLFYLITYNWIKYQFDKFNKTQKKEEHTKRFVDNIYIWLPSIAFLSYLWIVNY